MRTRAIRTALIGVIVLALAGCGGDGAVVARDDASTSSSPRTSNDGLTTTAPATTAVPTTTAPTTTAPTTTAPSVQLQQAKSSLITAEDLPAGFVAAQPTTSSGSGNDSAPALPECAHVDAAAKGSGLQGHANIKASSANKLVRIEESVTVADAVSIKRTFDAYDDPKTGPCLQAMFAAIFQQPGLLPTGTKIGALTVEPVKVSAGEAAFGYDITVVVTSTDGRATSTSLVRFDFIRAGNAAAILIATALPGAEPFDMAQLEKTAGDRLAAAPEPFST